MAENKDFEAIMKEITGGLTGDPEADMKYLDEQGNKYKDHEYGKEILRACGRLMYNLIPDDKKEELNKVLAKDNLGYEAAMEEVQFNIYKKNYDKALKLIEDMITKYEEMNMFSDDAVSEYHCFREPMEEILYREFNDVQKDIRRATVDFAELYLTYGGLLVELQRPEEAEKALAVAMRWNPASTKIAFEHAETFKMRGMIEEFKDATLQTFKYAFRTGDLARCYRNLGYYYVEKQDYLVATCVLLYSNHFERSQMVASELYYIEQVSGKQFDPSGEEMDKCFESNGIPNGPQIEMLKIAYAYGQHFYEQGDMASAEYFLGIFVSFIQDEKAQKMYEDAKAKVGEHA